MRVAVYLLLLLLATGFALVWGSKGERWIGATLLGGNIVSFAVERTLEHSFASVSLVYLIVDAGLAVLLCAIAVRFPSWVAILVSAFQINGTLGHVVKLVAPHTIPFSYAFLLRFWAWPMVAALLLARCAPRLREILTVGSLNKVPAAPLTRRPAR